MKVFDPGHVYELEQKYGGLQTIKFVKDNLGFQQDDEHNGVLCQELLRVLIDRVNFLNAQVPCYENITILKNLRESLILFEQRALTRKLTKLPYPEQVKPGKDGHLFTINGAADVNEEF